MPLAQKIFFYSISFFLFILVFELVRKRRLTEEYSWLWLLISVMLFILITKFELLVKISSALQATTSIVLLFLGTIALLVLVLQLFMINSKQSIQIRNLSQEIALIKEKLKKKVTKKEE